MVIVSCGDGISNELRAFFLFSHVFLCVCVHTLVACTNIMFTVVDVKGEGGRDLMGIHITICIKYPEEIAYSA